MGTRAKRKTFVNEPLPPTPQILYCTLLNLLHTIGGRDISRRKATYFSKPAAEQLPLVAQQSVPRHRRISITHEIDRLPLTNSTAICDQPHLRSRRPQSIERAGIFIGSTETQHCCGFISKDAQFMNQPTSVDWGMTL